MRAWMALLITVTLGCACVRHERPTPEAKAPAPKVEAPRAPAPKVEAPAPPPAPAAPPAVAFDPGRVMIHFAFDDFTLTPKARRVLERIARWMREHPEARLIIEGHCCDIGTEEYNLALGDRRAYSAKRYLVNLGIGPERISTISYGESRPLLPNDCEEHRAQNRRDQFQVASR